KMHLQVLLKGVFSQGLSGHRGVGTGHILTDLDIGHRESHSIHDFRMTNDLGLHLGRTDAEPFRLNHLVAASDKIEISFFVPLDLVAAEHQRLAGEFRMGTKHLRSRLGVPPISLGDGRPAMHEFSYDIRRAFLAILVQYQNLTVWDGLPDRGWM